MKKVRSLAALLLAVMMVVSLAACNGGAGGDSAPVTIVGKWKTTMNVGEMMKKAAESSSETMPSGSEAMLKVYDGVVADMTMEFTEDGKCTGSVGEESRKAMIEKLKENMKDILPEMFAAQGVSEEQLDQYFAQKGITREDFVNQYTDQMEKSMNESLGKGTNSTYRIDGDKLYITKEGEKEDTSHYVVFTLTADKLTFTDVVGSTDNESTNSFMKEEFLPMEFTRIQ